jgi:hypothetical protein
MRTNRPYWVLLAALVAAGTPLTISNGRIVEATAECSEASCCPETRSICVIGDVQTGNRYYIPQGHCIDPKQPLPSP